MNKGFFSVVIIVFVFIISIFFFTLNSQKEIYFSDSYRQMIFDSEQAYAMINKDFFVTCNVADIKEEYGDCKVINKENNLVIINCKKGIFSKTFNFEYFVSDCSENPDTENPNNFDIYSLVDWCIRTNCDIYVNGSENYKQEMELCLINPNVCDSFAYNWRKELDDLIKNQ